LGRNSKNIRPSDGKYLRKNLKLFVKVNHPPHQVLVFKGTEAMSEERGTGFFSFDDVLSDLDTEPTEIGPEDARVGVHSGFWKRALEAKHDLDCLIKGAQGCGKFAHKSTRLKQS
jgi:hypothetical protein